MKTAQPSPHRAHRSRDSPLPPPLRRHRNHRRQSLIRPQAAPQPITDPPLPCKPAPPRRLSVFTVVPNLGFTPITVAPSNRSKLSTPSSIPHELVLSPASSDHPSPAAGLYLNRISVLKHRRCSMMLSGSLCFQKR
ncbi:hypothetical protein M0R45_006051 [Rubus argutus]|uniref:Uncharacterized protein n=1 Tax=Rubus argutus TaxID=59490 RepID=A0AAW1YPH2_RUBAR